jgi:hypothetical protein
MCSISQTVGSLVFRSEGALFLRYQLRIGVSKQNKMGRAKMQRPRPLRLPKLNNTFTINNIRMRIPGDGDQRFPAIVIAIPG